MFELVGIAQNTMQRCKKLLGRKLFFVVVLWNFHHQKDAIDIENLKAVNFAVIANCQYD